MRNYIGIIGCCIAGFFMFSYPIPALILVAICTVYNLRLDYKMGNWPYQKKDKNENV